jgi:hypothetical protein
LGDAPREGKVFTPTVFWVSPGTRFRDLEAIRQFETDLRAGIGKASLI